MPTSSQSQILSMVDYRLLKKLPDRISINRKSAVESKRRQPKDNRRSSVRKKDGNNQSLLSLNTNARHRSSGKI
jgi:hypothetical protein